MTDKEQNEVRQSYHKHCKDCGKYVKRSLWVEKNHKWKKHALCQYCISNYDEPEK